jgi:hypothetical protein
MTNGKWQMANGKWEIKTYKEIRNRKSTIENKK